MTKQENKSEKPDQADNLQDNLPEKNNENTAKTPRDENNGGGQNESAQEPEPSEDMTANQSPEAKIKMLEEKLLETQDQFLRKAAEFENFRKRMNQEKQNSIEYANQSLLLDIIPIIDDFERAIQAGENSTDYNAFLEGIKMIEKRLTAQLEAKWGLKRFVSAGEPFDPNLHEALMMEKSSEVTEATVQEDFGKGYMLKDRVIRAAKVKVLMPEADNK